MASNETKPQLILIVDDDKSIWQITSKTLKKHGHHTKWISNGSEAVSWLVENRDVLLLLDYQLSDMTGEDVIRALTDQTCRIPFIMMTAHGSEALAVKMMKLGARDYLIKGKSFLKLLIPVVEQVLEHVSMEKRLAEAEQRVRIQSAALEAASNAVVITDRHARITWVNPAFTKLTGYSSDEVTGKTPRILKSGQHDKNFYKELWQTILAGDTWRGEMVNRRKDGRTGIDDQSITPIRDAAGQITHFIAIKQDISKRRRMESDLRDSEQKYRDLFNQIADSIFIFDAKTHYFLDCNQAVERIYGYGLDELRSMTPFDLHPPDDLKQVKQTIDIRNVNEPFRYTHVTKQGKRIAVEILSDAIRYQGKSAYISIVRDITERQKVEESLRASESRFRELFENSPDAVFVEDLSGKVLDVNRAACELQRMDRAELIGTNVTELVPPEHTDEVISSFKKMILGELQFQEGFSWTKDKRTIPVEIRARSIYFAGEPAVLLHVRDVTERKQAEKNLRDAHAQTEQLLASISSILIGIDSEGRVTRWNAAAAETFGLVDAAVVGKPFLACGISWDWTQILPRINECQDLDQPTHLYDVRFSRPGGGEGLLSLTVNPIRNETRQSAGYLLLGRETTQQKQLEMQLAQASKLESIGQLAAGIAHEINTPIQYVGDNARFLLDAFGDLSTLLKQHSDVLKSATEGWVARETLEQLDAAVQDADLDYLVDEIPLAVQQSLEGVERVTNIVRAMKEFSHPGVGEKTIIDLNKAIDSTITVCRNEWKYVAEVVTEFDPDLPSIACYPGDFNQVIVNLIVNAAHAISDVVGDGSNGKGTITVRTRTLQGMVEVRISDTGTGIPEEVRSKIFDPFFTTKDVGKGTGQGLAISYAVIVDKHGGSLFVETEDGAGTTFIIRLPCN